MILQLTSPIPVTTPKGSALAHAIIDYGIESDLFWVCFQDDTGECWTWRNSEIRAQKNVTQGRDYISPFCNSEKIENEDLINECMKKCDKVLESLYKINKFFE